MKTFVGALGASQRAMSGKSKLRGIPLLFYSALPSSPFRVSEYDPVGVSAAGVGILGEDTIRAFGVLSHDIAKLHTELVA